MMTIHYQHIVDIQGMQNEDELDNGFQKYVYMCSQTHRWQLLQSIAMVYTNTWMDFVAKPKNFN